MTPSLIESAMSTESAMITGCSQSQVQGKIEKNYKNQKQNINPHQTIVHRGAIESFCISCNQPSSQMTGSRVDRPSLVSSHLQNPAAAPWLPISTLNEIFLWFCNFSLLPFMCPSSNSSQYLVNRWHFRCERELLQSSIQLYKEMEIGKWHEIGNIVI